MLTAAVGPLSSPDFAVSLDLKMGRVCVCVCVCGGIDSMKVWKGGGRIGL